MVERKGCGSVLQRRRRRGRPTGQSDVNDRQEAPGEHAAGLLGVIPIDVGEIGGEERVWIKIYIGDAPFSEVGLNGLDDIGVDFILEPV